MTALYIRADQQATTDERRELTERRDALNHWRAQATTAEHGLSRGDMTPAQAEPIFSAYSTSLDAVTTLELRIAGRA